MGAPEILEILDWVFLVAALCAMFAQWSTTSVSTYQTLNVAFWLLMAACFVCNGLQSDSWWQWFWYVAAALCVAAIFAGPRGRRYEALSQ